MVKKRKARGGDWAKMRDSQAETRTAKKGVDGREHVPDIACGKCKSFSQNAYTGDGSGYCTVLKIGSDVAVDPPVYILDGQAAFVTVFNKDSAQCEHYSEMSYIDTDPTECADPLHQRSARQMQNISKKQ